MLSDRERESLLEIEHRFLVDDPELAAEFSAPARHPHHDRRWWTLTTVIVVSSLFFALALVAGASGSALACATVTGLAVMTLRRPEPSSASKT
jgi:Protein of unknown function (DUF3040)